MNRAEAIGLSRHDLAIDRELADIGLSFQFLLDVTPINLGAAREGFLDGRDDVPRFEYRALEDDTDVIRTRLEAVDARALEDPTLSHLAQAKQRELGLQLEMLAARGSTAFHSLSVELYGAPSPSLVGEAHGILRAANPSVAVEWVGAEEFARAAGHELDWYREQHPELDAHVEVRPDCSAIMVSQAHVLVPTTARVPRTRIDAVIQHEVGTHVVTHVNGVRQPIRLLAGLAGYDETQEGLALLAEHLVGGLTMTRLRQLAGRVIAVDRMLAGESFRDVHTRLVEAGFSPGAAFVTAMRSFRSGGLTKDAVYLRGVMQLLAHVGSGGSIEPLLLGKMPLDAIPLVEDLVARGALIPPVLLPRYLVRSEAADRLRAITARTTVLDLAERDT
jgi:uncharacterized protein (TIGR02421 family)